MTQLTGPPHETRGRTPQPDRDAFRRVAAGGDTFAYTSMRDAGDTIVDFTPYADRIPFGGLLASLGYSGSDAVADGYVRVVDVTGGISLQIDSGGAFGPAGFRPLAILKGLTAKQFAPARELILQ